MALSTKAKKRLEVAIARKEEAELKAFAAREGIDLTKVPGYIP